MTDHDAPPSGARFVALGILLSKVSGLVREMILARFFGVGPHADVFRSAFRAPNVLQNLLGEQSLSAAFIPIYSRMLADGRREDAGRFAGAIFGILVAAVSALVILGVIFAPLIVAVLTPGFLVAEGAVDRYDLTVRAVRIIFPMTGFLVLSAWALGVLNSHRRFLLPYLSPIVWNAAIVTALLVAGARSGFLGEPAGAGLATLEGWLFAACFGALVGGVLQFVVQLPLALRLMRGFRLSLGRRVAGTGAALRAVGPALVGRGVVQLSLYVDLFLASFLAEGALSALGYAVMLINLPLGAFGMSVAAAELPELAAVDPKKAGDRLAGRVDRALRQTAFVLAPSVIGYLLFGFLVAGLLFRGGKFALADNTLVAVVLAAYALGMWASASSRLMQNTFFALGDTRTPARIAAARLIVSAALGTVLMLVLDRYRVAAVFGLDAGGDLRLGAVGLGLAASAGAWCELALLRLALSRRVAAVRLPTRALVRRFALSLLLALPALGVWLLVAGQGVRVEALTVLPVYAGVYLVYAWRTDAPELEMWLGRLRRKG